MFFSSDDSDIPEGAINVNTMLGDMIAGAPPIMRPVLIMSLINDLCKVAVCNDIPEADRSDPDAWEGKSARDLFESIIEPMRQALPDNEGMAEMWDRYSLWRAEELAQSSEPVVFPDDWT